MGKVIVIGNEKGGTGKSTLAMHFIVWFLRHSKKVASVDLDGRQGTLTHYIENRNAYSMITKVPLGESNHTSLKATEGLTKEEQENETKSFFELVEKLQNENDVVVIDTAGSDSFLFRAAHSVADILITPLNDSLIDLDVLASVDVQTLTIKTPGHYAQTVWQARQKRASLRKPQTKWFVLRNRLMHVSTRNEKLIWKLLEALGQRINFKPIAGLGERIIFRELFLMGLTLLDLDGTKTKIKKSVAHLSARQELNVILAEIGEQV